MRKIMFRGKTLDDGKWVYGYYVRQYGADEVPEEIVEEDGYCSNGRRKANV